MDPYLPRQRSSKNRKPLGDSTSRVNNQSLTPSSDPYPSSSSRLPHHESLKAEGNLPIRHRPISPTPPVKDKRLSEITDESQRNSNRDSQISTTSTNATGKSRRKTHVGPWRLGRTLGKGASGRVRKARHAVTGQDAAVKIVSKNVAAKLRTESLANLDMMIRPNLSSPNGQRRVIPFGIEREVVIMKLIEHPHIISLYDVWENRGELYLVLEYVEGGELFHHICENGRLPESEAVRIFRQMISGLSYCHRFNICHRDLKPENILMDRNKNVKIVDFGMAALQPANKWLNTSCGSPHYASPEVIKGQNYRGDKADVWSCGVILFAMLTGTLPFDSDGGYPEVIATVLAGQYTFPKGLSPFAKDLIHRMLQADPKERIAMKTMWNHPLLKRYENLDSVDANGDSYIGPPAPLTIDDCGELIEDRSEIDEELLRNLQNLWHGVNAEDLAQQLLSKEPNFERVLYNKLLRFREDQLENYQGPPIEYSVSDYHHAPRKMPPRSATRMSLRKLSGNRNVSQFSILKDDIPVRQSKSYKRQPSVAETEGSYDPFRTSRGQIGRAQPEQARITVLRGRSSSHQQRMSNTSLNRRIVSKASVQNPNLARLQQTDAYSIMSSPPANHSSSPNQYSSSIHGRISRCPSKRSLSGSAAVRTSMSYRRGVSFAHMRRRSAAHHLQIGKQRDSASLNLQERYLHDRPNPGPSNQQSLLRSESLLSTASSVICSRKPPPKPAEDVAIRKIKTASHYWKEDTRKVSTELEKACDEAFNRFSMASSVMTTTSGTPAPSYHTPATSIGIREVSHLSLTGADNDDSRKRGEQAHRDRPLPLLPSYEHIGSFTYQELEKTRALLKKRAAETSSIMSPGYFDDVIAHMDRLMQPSTARIHQLDQRATSTPIKKSDSRQNKEALDRLLSRGPFGLRSTSEPIKQSHGNHSSSRKHGRSTLRIVEDEAPISPTKPLTIRKKSGSTTASAESVVIRRSKENLLYGEENRYDRFQGGERHSAGLGLLENSLEPIVEDEDKENRDPRTAKTHSGEVKKRSWFRRHEATQRTQDDDIGPPLPPKDEPLSHEIQNNGMKRDSKGSKRSSNAPSDESRVSDTKKPTGGKGRFFKIFSKRDSKESKSSAEQSCGDYNLNDISSMASGSSSQLNRVYMSGAIQNTSTATVSRRQRHNSGKTVTIKPPPVRMIQPQHQNWFARFLRIKPAMSIVCFQVSKVRARKEIGSVFREWRKYGMRDIVIDKAAGRLWARVAEKNSLHIKPVSLAVELFTVLHHGRKANLSLARFTQEKGAKSSFERVLEALEGVLMARGFLVTNETKKEEMKRVLGGGGK